MNPVKVEAEGIEEVRVTLNDHVEFVLCTHGALYLAQLLQDVAKRQYCDGYRHGDESTILSYITVKTKRRAELRASDVPHGLDPDDCVID